MLTQHQMRNLKCKIIEENVKFLKRLEFKISNKGKRFPIDVLDP